jgi:hypothetical protein
MAVINGRGIWGVRAFVQTGTWTRPTDWLALNAPTDNTEQFTGLLAITNDDSNYVTLMVTSTGNYTVDWGDGTVTTHASSTNAEKKYEYSAISESTLCSRGYKQVVVKVTGATITQLHTVRPHTALASATNVLYTWLEYHVNLPNCTLLSLNRGSISNGAYQTWVEKVTLNKLASNFSNFNYQFAFFYSLQEVVINATTTNVTSMTQMFINCYYLKSVPLFDTSNVVTANDMFNGCYSLETILSFNFGSVTNGTAMFYNCYGLTSVPALNFTNATNLNSLFNGCSNLVTIPSITTTKVVNTYNMFSGCYSLETVPLFDTSTVTSPYSMFSYCYSLKEIPAFDMSQATNFSGFFESCVSLKTIPLLNTQKVTSWGGAFINCPSLDKLPALDLTAASTITNMFTGTNGIVEVPFVNIRNSFSFVNMMLSRTAIVDIFNGLASGVTSKIITVSGNPGYTSLSVSERAIATNKGWTIA